MSYARIGGTGGYVPDQVLSNADLEKRIDTTDEWIKRRVGVRKRHIIGDSGETTVSMSLRAAKQALQAASLEPHEIDLVLVATATPQCHFPSNACILQHELGIRNKTPAFDLNAACAGFIYAISVAEHYFRADAVEHVLVVGVDSLTQLLDWQDRSTCILFGDGAGAVVLSADKQAGILSTHIHADGAYHQLIKANNTISDRDASQFIKMQGNEVFKIAVATLGEIVEQTLEQNGMKKTNIDWLIPHQANLRIIAATAKRLGMPLERVVITLEEHGNTSAASVPLALDYAVRCGKVRRGDTLLLEAFGAGFAWGSALINY